MNQLQENILKLKKEKHALILAHYYQRLEVQDIADAVCDSFEMAKRARDAREQIIVICGVRFMGESAKILAPDKTVLLPASDAGCPLADMVTPEDVQALRQVNPGAAVMCYVNSSAAVKAECDVCCTSSSALRIARGLAEKEIIFVPDSNLGRYVAEQVPEKTFHVHNGFCPTHHRVTEEEVALAKKQHPQAKLAAHPECREEVLKHADFIGSTSEIIQFVQTDDAKEFLIGTEDGIIDRLRRELPEKTILPVTSGFVCSNMKKTHLEDVLHVLETGANEVRMTEAEIAAAKKPLDRMVSM